MDEMMADLTLAIDVSVDSPTLMVLLMLLHLYHRIERLYLWRQGNGIETTVLTEEPNRARRRSWSPDPPPFLR
jgi:hypothetical protein